MYDYKKKVKKHAALNDAKNAFKDILDCGITEFNGGIYLSLFFSKDDFIFKSSYDAIEKECFINKFSVHDWVKDYVKDTTLPVSLEYSLLWTLLAYDMLAKEHINNVSCVIGVDEEGDNVTWRMYTRRGSETWLGDEWEEDMTQPVVLFDECSDVYDFLKTLK